MDFLTDTLNESKKKIKNLWSPFYSWLKKRNPKFVKRTSKEKT